MKKEYFLITFYLPSISIDIMRTIFVYNFRLISRISGDYIFLERRYRTFKKRGRDVRTSRPHVVIFKSLGWSAVSVTVADSTILVIVGFFGDEDLTKAMTVCFTHE